MSKETTAFGRFCDFFDKEGVPYLPFTKDIMDEGKMLIEVYQVHFEFDRASGNFLGVVDIEMSEFHPKRSPDVSNHREGELAWQSSADLTS